MASSTSSASRPEIAAPAGNLEKLRIAVRYGADAVYFGGEQFNLRIRTGNFPEEDLRRGVDFCRQQGVRTVFLLNSFLHEKDLTPAAEYIDQIAGFSFDAVMISDPGMLMLLKEAGIRGEIHLSTQMSTLNHRAVRFWQDQGIRRIVLGREATLEEIREIRRHTDAEIEVFVHGALCISYSGRCLLSRFLSGRDANQGSCSHPCRWKFSLMEEKRPGHLMDIEEYRAGTEILSSKDLCLLRLIPEYAAAGVDAFKIEGRMKSLYYTANVTRIYRHALECSGNPELFRKFLPYWQDELDLVSHRPYTEDLFNEFDQMGFTEITYIKKVLFLGYREDGEAIGDRVPIRVFNPILRGETLEAIFPIRDHQILDGHFTVMEILDGDESVEMARPGRSCLITFDRPMGKDAILRRRLPS